MNKIKLMSTIANATLKTKIISSVIAVTVIGATTTAVIVSNNTKNQSDKGVAIASSEVIESSLSGEGNNQSFFEQGDSAIAVSEDIKSEEVDSEEVKTEVKEDGSTVVTHSDGTVDTVTVDGKVETVKADGTVTHSTKEVSKDVTKVTDKKVEESKPTPVPVVESKPAPVVETKPEPVKQVDEVTSVPFTPTREVLTTVPGLENLSSLSGTNVRGSFVSLLNKTLRSIEETNQDEIRRVWEGKRVGGYTVKSVTFYGTKGNHYVQQTLQQYLNAINRFAPTYNSKRYDEYIALQANGTDIYVWRMVVEFE